MPKNKGLSRFYRLVRNNSIMTNKEAKEKAIRKAWGKYWDEVKDNVIGMGTHGGWADNDVIHYNEDLGCDSKGFEFQTGLYRPKQLSGIEDNNGWTRIEPDGSNLPDTTSDELFKVGSLKNDGRFDTIESSGTARWLKWLIFQSDHFKATHFKPIEVEKPPIW